jgi:hypothetical protein
MFPTVTIIINIISQGCIRRAEGCSRHGAGGEQGRLNTPTADGHDQNPIAHAQISAVSGLTRDVAQLPAGEGGESNHQQLRAQTTPVHTG